VPLNRECDAICSEVARLLKEERESQGVSLNSLAERAGLSRQAVAFVEQELRSPSLDTLMRLTIGLEIKLEDIISRARRSSGIKKSNRILRKS
jgi:transcriptional regulator with XRE-family HTH domain